MLDEFFLNSNIFVINETIKRLQHEDAKQTILIVDDEALLVDSLSVFISDMVKDLRILTASNGRKALEILEKEKINLMLLDIQMPVTKKPGSVLSFKTIVFFLYLLNIDAKYKFNYTIVFKERTDSKKGISI